MPNPGYWIPVKRFICAFAITSRGHCTPSQQGTPTIWRIRKKWSQIFVTLVADLSSESPRMRGEAGSILTRGTEICAILILP